MFLTAIISYPLAWLLDSLGSVHRDEPGKFTNQQLAVLIKHHEDLGDGEGHLSTDAARIILGVLNNDQREVGGEISKPALRYDQSSEDMEKGSIQITRGIIVKWSAVRTVDIEEIVDKRFIDKVLSWSYSRVPVIGRDANIDRGKRYARESVWEGTKLFGYLHIKVGASTRT